MAKWGKDITMQAHEIQQSGMTTQMPKYIPWVQNNLIPSENNIPDIVFFRIWEKMVEEGKDRIVFYNGQINTAEKFVSYMKSKNVHPIAIMDTDSEEIVLLAWLTDYYYGSAQGHFCPIGSYRRGAGLEVMRMWKEACDCNTGMKLIRCVWGNTPAEYERVLKLVHILGFKEVGRVPRACFLPYEDKFSDYVITYHSFEEVE